MRSGLAQVLLLCCLALRPGAAAVPPVSPLWHRSVEIAITVAPDGTAQSREVWSVRADTEAVARIVAQQSFSLIADMERVALVRAATIKPDGSRHPVAAAAVMDQPLGAGSVAPTFSAQRTRTLLFPSVAAGDTVRYELRRTAFATLFPGQFTTTLQPGGWPYLDRVELSLALPRGMQVIAAASGLQEAAPQPLPGGGTLRRWHKAPTGEGAVALDLSSIRDYPTLGRLYARRAWPRSQPTPRLRALAARLTRGAATPREQALRLYRFVASDVRYVAAFLGEGRVVPRAAETVLAEGWGDCKDHAALLQALLAARGIAAQPVLISLRNLYALDGPAGLAALNHVITYVPMLDLYLDSTAPYAPFGMLPLSEYDKPVVLAHPAAARLARTPALPPEPVASRTDSAVVIAPDGAVSGTTTTEAAGPQAIVLRATAAWIEGRGLAGAAASQLRELGTPGRGGFAFASPEPDSPSYAVSAHFALDEPLADGGATPFRLPGGLGLSEAPGRLLLGTGPTEDGGHVCFPGREVQTVALRLPSGTRLEQAPPDLEVADGGARYRATYRLDGAVLHATRVFSVATGRVFCDGQAHAAMMRVLQAARRDQGTLIALRRTGQPPGGPSLAAGADAARVGTAAAGPPGAGPPGGPPGAGPPGGPPGAGPPGGPPGAGPSVDGPPGAGRATAAADRAVDAGIAVADPP